MCVCGVCVHTCVHTTMCAYDHAYMRLYVHVYACVLYYCVQCRASLRKVDTAESIPERLESYK